MTQKLKNCFFGKIAIRATQSISTLQTQCWNDIFWWNDSPVAAVCVWISKTALSSWLQERAEGLWSVLSDRETISCFWRWLRYLLALEGVGGERLLLRVLTHITKLSLSVDSWSLCRSVTLREAEGAKIAVVREVKGGQTFPAYDRADSSGLPRPAASEMDNLPWLRLVLISILDY